MRFLASCVSFLLICSASAGAKHPLKDTAVPFEVLPIRTQFSPGFNEPQDFVIRTPRQWCRFWAQVHAGLSPVPPCDLSAIDFRREVVIASAVGGRPNGCYGVGIRSITRARRPHRLQVLVNERVAGPGCTCTQALVWPVTAVVVSSDAYHRERADLIILAVTSQARPAAGVGEAPIAKWKEAGLLRPSVLKPVRAARACRSTSARSIVAGGRSSRATEGA